MRVAVIGAGPSGLVTLKYLLSAHTYLVTEPIEVVLFEAEDDLGGTFTYRVYEDAELVSSKYLTAFSDLRFPAQAPDFVTPEVYVNYLREYATRFDLWRHMYFSTKVTKVTRVQTATSRGHTVTVEQQPGVSCDLHFDAVAVCSGLNMEPSIPDLPGLDKVPLVLHSSQVKGREQLQVAGTKPATVVVLGIGETGMDMGHLAVTTAGVGATVMCHRDGFWCAPKRTPEPVILGIWGDKDGSKRPAKPLDTATASLFDTVYAHPKLQRGSCIWSYYTWVIKTLMYSVTGTYGLHQWIGQYSPDRMQTDAIFFVKSDRAMPYLSAPYRKSGLMDRVREFWVTLPVQGTNGKHIDLAPWPTCVDDEGIMHFQETTRAESYTIKSVVVKPDVVILATGYTRRFRFLDDSYGSPNTADVRGIWHAEDVSVAFIGFVRPSFGAIPPLSEMQAQLWVLRLVQADRAGRGAEGDAVRPGPDPDDGSAALAPYELDYALHARAGRDVFRERCGVDHDSYALQLALDMGSAPTFGHVRRQGLRALWTWAMGNNFNTKFRLVGPWSEPYMARHILSRELFDVTRRSGGLPFFLLFTLVPFVAFGAASLALYACDWVAACFAAPAQPVVLSGLAGVTTAAPKLRGSPSRSRCHSVSGSLDAES